MEKTANALTATVRACACDAPEISSHSNSPNAAHRRNVASSLVPKLRLGNERKRDVFALGYFLMPPKALNQVTIEAAMRMMTSGW